jgi:hypothetical protein
MTQFDLWASRLIQCGQELIVELLPACQTGYLERTLAKQNRASSTNYCRKPARNECLLENASVQPLHTLLRTLKCTRNHSLCLRSLKLSGRHILLEHQVQLSISHIFGLWQTEITIDETQRRHSRPEESSVWTPVPGSRVQHVGCQNAGPDAGDVVGVPGDHGCLVSKAGGGDLGDDDIWEASAIIREGSQSCYSQVKGPTVES